MKTFTLAELELLITGTKSRVNSAASHGTLCAASLDLATALHAALVREAERAAEVAKLREALEGILECGIEWSARVDAHDIAHAALSQVEAPKGG